MAKKKGSPKNPGPGQRPTPQHLRSVWDSDYIPQWRRPAMEKAIADAEERLGVTIPESLRAQLAVQNGGPVFLSKDGVPFEDGCRDWTNAIVDGLEPVEEWEIAAESEWFQNASPIPGMELLVIIACHSEAQLCLDYRDCGPNGMPAIVFFDVCMNPAEEGIVAGTVTEFLTALIASKGVGA